MTAMTLDNSSSKMHPKKFNLWLFNIGIVMLFSGLTSAYIVRKGDGNWFSFDLPPVFLYSTIIILLSSASMLYAYRSAKQDNISGLKMGLWLTIALGIGFTVSQFMGWMAMVDEGLYLTTPKEGDKVSASFVYVISFLHLAHIVAGLVFLSITTVRAYQLRVHRKSTLLIDMCNTYWHFIGLLWVYLYLFFYFAH